MVLLSALAAIPLLIWIYLLAGRGGFWRLSRHLSPALPRSAPKLVAAVIAARNEAAVIGQTIASLLLQDFPIPPHVFVVDDDSTDGTAEIAQHTAERMERPDSLTIIRGRALPAGWTGKVWALSQGVAEAGNLHPDYLFLTDADIHHGPRVISELVAIAEAQNYDLVTYMVKLASRTASEKLLIPAFVFFFLKLYPPLWVRSQNAKTAAAAGGCVLIRPEVLSKIGGFAAIRGEVIDDCALARAVKRSGGRIWMGLTATSESIRPYGSLGEIGRMISRTAFNQLHHSVWLLVITVLALLITYVAPVALVSTGKMPFIALGAAAWALMSIAYLPAVRFYRISPLWCLSLPLAAVFYLGATLYSALTYWQGSGGRWKGRVQDARA